MSYIFFLNLIIESLYKNKKERVNIIYIYIYINYHVLSR